MVLLPEKECVYCAILTEYLNVVRVNLSLQMVITSLSSSVARIEMTDVASVVMKVVQIPRNKE